MLAATKAAAMKPLAFAASLLEKGSSLLPGAATPRHNQNGINFSIFPSISNFLGAVSSAFGVAASFASVSTEAAGRYHGNYAVFQLIYF